MQIEIQDLEDTLVLVKLAGRMDILGTQDIDMKFTAATATRKAGVIVDMAEVEFIASIGIRTLLSNAKAQGSRGGKMVLCNTQELVREVLTTAGIDQLIPIANDLEAAKELARVD